MIDFTVPQNPAANDAQTQWGLNAWLPTQDAWYRYAIGFRLAADELIDRLSEPGEYRGHLNDVVVYPIMFLYRHDLELLLKRLIIESEELDGVPRDPPTDHDLMRLWRKLRIVLREVWAGHAEESLREDIDRRLRQFSTVDPRSESFRYPTRRSGGSSIGDLEWINLRSLRAAVADLSGELEMAFGGGKLEDEPV